MTKIHEPFENALLLEVQSSTSDDNQLQANSSRLFKGKNEKIYDRGIYFTILFDRYVSYHVINESYAKPDPLSEYVAGEFCTFCIFPRSRYMEHILQETFAEDIYPSELRHYTLFAANHIVHVISREEPNIIIHNS